MISTWCSQQPFFRSAGAPVLRQAPVVQPANPTLGVTLTIAGNEWLYAQTISYQWLLGGTPIPGATTNTLDTTSLAVGNLISVRVTATSITGSTTVVSNTVTIGL